MSILGIVKKLDEADAEIREQLKLQGRQLPGRGTLGVSLDYGKTHQDGNLAILNKF